MSLVKHGRTEMMHSNFCKTQLQTCTNDVHVQSLTSNLCQGRHLRGLRSVAPPPRKKKKKKKEKKKKEKKKRKKKGNYE